MEGELPAHFFRALEQAGLNNVRIVGSRRSRIDLHIDDFLIEGEKNGTLQRGWCIVDQRMDGVRWFTKNADGTWPGEVNERSLW